VLRRRAVTISLIGLAAAPVLTLARTIRPQSQWADRSRRQPVLLIINAIDLLKRN
jgi:hypothetical protein